MNKRLKLKDEEVRILKEALGRFFENEIDEEYSDLKLGLIYDFIVENMAPIYYNLGIKDTVAFLSDKLDDVYHLEL